MSNAADQIIKITLDLAPIQSFRDTLNESLQSVIRNSELVQSSLVGISTGIAAFRDLKTATQSIKAFQAGVKGIKNTEQTLTTFSKLGTAFGQLKKNSNGVRNITGAFQTIFGMGPQGLILVAVISAIAAAAFLIIKNWKPISAFLKNLLNSIHTGLINLKNSIVTFFTVTIPQAWNTFMAFLKTWGPLLLTILAPVLGIPLIIIQHWGQIKTFFTTLWNGIISFFKTTIPKWIKSFIQWINKLPHQIGSAVSQMLSSIVKFGLSAWKWVTTQLPKIIQGIITWFQQLPGKIWVFLVDIVAKVGQWGSNMVQKAAIEIPLFIHRVVSFVQELPGKIWTFFSEVVSKVVQWAGNLVSTAATEIPKFVSKVTGFIGELPEKMLDIGKNIVSGIWNGISGTIGWLHDKITGFCKGIVQGFKDKLKIHSPSQLFADEIGQNIALGIGLGFSEHIPAVLSAMKDTIPTRLNSFLGINLTGPSTSYGSNLTYAGTPATTVTRGTTLQFTQNNYSPKAIGSAEAARQTRNLLRQASLTLRRR